MFPDYLQKSLGALIIAPAPVLTATLSKLEGRQSSSPEKMCLKRVSAKFPQTQSCKIWHCFVTIASAAGVSDVSIFVVSYVIVITCYNMLYHIIISTKLRQKMHSANLLRLQQGTSCLFDNVPQAAQQREPQLGDLPERYVPPPLTLLTGNGLNKKNETGTHSCLTFHIGSSVLLPSLFEKLRGSKGKDSFMP